MLNLEMMIHNAQIFKVFLIQVNLNLLETVSLGKAQKQNPREKKWENKNSNTNIHNCYYNYLGKSICKLLKRVNRIVAQEAKKCNRKANSIFFYF